MFVGFDSHHPLTRSATQQHLHYGQVRRRVAGMKMVLFILIPLTLGMPTIAKQNAIFRNKNTEQRIVVGELKTRDGKTLRGDARLLASNIVKIGDTRVLLNNVQKLKFNRPQVLSNDVRHNDSEIVAVPHAGALSWRGTYIALPVKEMDDTRVLFHDAPKDLFLSTVNTAAVFFRPTSLYEAYQLRGRKPGLLLRSGDFMQGEFMGIKDGHIKIQSILFGQKTLPIDQVIALWLQPARSTNRPHFSIRTKTGSLILTEKLSILNGAVIPINTPFRKHRLTQDEILEINHGRTVNLLSQAWAKVDDASPEKKAELLTGGSSHRKTIRLREELQSIEQKLADAKLIMINAEKAMAASVSKRQSLMKNRKRLQDKWRDQNRAYWKLHSEKLRAASAAKTRHNDVVRALRRLNIAETNLAHHTGKLNDFKKHLNQPNAKLEKNDRRKRESLMRHIQRAKKDIQRAQQELDAARLDSKKLQTKAIPLDKSAEDFKKALDKTKEEIALEMVAYRQSISEYQARTKEVSVARNKVSEIQREKDRILGELGPGETRSQKN